MTTSKQVREDHQQSGNGQSGPQEDAQAAVMQAEDFQALHAVILQAARCRIGDGENVPPVVLCATMRDHRVDAINFISADQLMEQCKGNKDLFAIVLKQLAAEDAFDLVAYATEAWIVRAAADGRKPLDLSVRPSQSPDRQEAYVVTMYSHDNQFFGMHMINREHRELEEGEFEVVRDNMQGRFVREAPTLQ